MVTGIVRPSAGGHGALRPCHFRERPHNPGGVGTGEQSFAVPHDLQSDRFPQDTSHLAFYRAPLLDLSSYVGDVTEIQNDAETYAATIYNYLRRENDFAMALRRIELLGGMMVPSLGTARNPM